MVVCTHFHYDHVGWNTTVIGDERVPSFPNARYLFAEEEWDAVKDWTQSSELDDMLQESFERDVAYPVAREACELVPSTCRITSEVSLLPSPGHSPDTSPS